MPDTVKALKAKRSGTAEANRKASILIGQHSYEKQLNFYIIQEAEYHVACSQP